MKPIVSLEIAGQAHSFEYGKTICHVYRMVADQPFNHIEAIEHGSQRIFLFHVPRYIMYLTGQELFETSMPEREVERITSDMDRAVGWNADLVIRDEAPQEVVDRYVRLATPILRREVVVVPTEWVL